MKKTFLFVMVALCSMSMRAANPEAVYITGDATPGGWSTDAAANQMYKTGEGTFVWTGTLAEGELKFLAGNDWVPSYGPAGGADMVLGENALLVRNSYDESDNKFAVAAGDYQLWLNISDDNAPQVWVSQLNWESVHMFVVPEALWGSEWSHDYTLKVSLKRWNGDDEQPSNWDQYTFFKTDALYDYKAVYAGDVWVCFGGFAQMTFEAYNGDDKVLTYTFWPEETTDGHWIAKDDFVNKVFYGWNVTEYPLADFPFISSTAGNRIWFDNSKTQWEHVYVRIGRDELTGAGNYAATWPMTQLAGTNLWYADSEAWENALVWTITDVNENNGDVSVYEIPEGANRLYYFCYSITERVLYVVDGDAAQGTDAIGVNYWACHNVPFFSRDGLTPGAYGTVCLPMGSPEFAGAEFFRVAGKELDTNNEPTDIVIESVNSIEAGVPYIFRATAEIMVLHNEGTYADEPDNSHSNGLIGSYTEEDIADDPNHYILHENKLYQVNNSKVGKYRAYFDFSQMSEFDESVPAAGARRRMSVDRAPQAIDMIQDNGAKSRKMIRDGQLIILHQDKLFNAQGAQLY